MIKVMQSLFECEFFFNIKFNIEVLSNNGDKTVPFNF